MAKQAMLLPAIGQAQFQPTLRVQPTVQRASGTAAVGFKLRRRYTITNNLTQPLVDFPYLIAIGETATAFVTAGKALASGNDVRFVLAGVEVARTLKGWNGASSGAWVIIPYLAAGDSITFDMLYNNPQAGTPPTLTLGTDAPIFDTATSTNAQRKYLVDRTVGNAGLGGWALSSGTVQPEVKFGLPGSWRPITTLPSTDDRRQELYSTYTATGTKYQARFDAKRMRGGTMSGNEKNGADGVVLKLPVPITSVVCDLRLTNMARGDTDTTSVGRFVILARNSDNEPWTITTEINTLYATETVVAAATYTLATPARQLAFAVWPRANANISKAARSARSIEAEWNTQLDVNIDTSLIVQTTAQGETTVYELASEIRYTGGGGAIGTPPYHAIYLGNAKSSSAAGAPRLSAELNQVVQIDTIKRLAEIWDSTLTTKIEDVPLDAYDVVNGTTDARTGLLVERPAAAWLPMMPVAKIIPNGDFAVDLSSWATVSTHASATSVSRTRDAAVSADGNGSQRVTITTSTAPTLTEITKDRNTTFLPVGSRKSIEVSHDVQVSSLNLVPRVFIEFYKEDQVTLITTRGESQTEGGLAATGVFERHALSVLVPSGAVYWRFVLTVYSAAVNATGSVYLDRVRAFDADLVVIDVAKGTLVLSAEWYPGHYAYA